MTDSSCETLLPPETLLDYWHEALSGDAENDVEEHLMACEACHRELWRIVDLVEAIRSLVRRGAVRVVVTPSFLDRLGREGIRVREYRVPPGGSVACTISPEDDVVVARLAAELGQGDRFDLLACDAQGREQERMRSLPVRADQREILVAESTDVLRALPSQTSLFRLFAKDERGDRHVADYTFHHTRYAAPDG